ncbi:MAG: O-antigen ligase family protein [Candidatus Rokubacteria bacterium]|nr:O-antigen ligase family protein [Candidatus Rokubacteria bacterium]
MAPAVAAPNVPDGSVPFWGLMTFTFILLLAPQSLVPALAPLRIALVTAGLAIAAHLGGRFVRGRPFMSLTREVWITACLVGWAIVTLPLSYWPGGSVSLLLGQYFKALAVFWLIGNVVTSLPRVRLLTQGLSLMAVPLAVSGVSNYLSGEFIAGGVHRRIHGFDAPLTGNPNDLALMLSLILPLSVALVLATRRPLLRVLLLGSVVLSVVGVIVTFSRGGFLALSTIVAMYLWKLRGRREWGWALAVPLVVLAGLPFLPEGYVGRLETITDIQSDPTGSAQARWTDLNAATSFVLANPIVGAGVGMNALALNELRGATWREVHNVYLEYAVDLGLPGLVLFLVLVFGCLRCATFVQRRSAGVPALRELFYLAEGIQISLAAFAVAALFYPAAYHFYFYYLGGLAVAVKAVYEAGAHRTGLDR